MGEFNLLDEEWINVVTDYKGTTKLVGMKEFFENAHNYIALAGDTPTQDFAVMRFLLAVLHTVFSRYDADGKAYEMLEMNDRMQPIEEPEEYLEEYEDLLMDTWKDLWNKGEFPKVVNDYLEEWKDRFNLFDNKYPFYQVTESFFDDCDLVNQKGATDSASSISFKTVNRKVSETGENYAIFSMINSPEKGHKGKLEDDQLCRWLITYMAYSETADKTKFTRYHDIKNIKKYSGHKGWQYSIGAIHYKADNLFKTLLLNLVLVHPNEKFVGKMQTPAWELSPEENVRFYLENNSIDNLARLYTDYSRCVYIPKEENEFGRFFNIVQLPILDKKDNFLECMTIWEYVKKKGDESKTWHPKENNVNEAMWRNFGLIYLGDKTNNPDYRAPDIIKWFREISGNISSSDRIRLSAIGIKSDSSSSNTMTNEMYDDLNLNLDVSTDIEKNGWVLRINELIELTKSFIENKYLNYLKSAYKLSTGNGDPKKALINPSLEHLYSVIDKPFKNWLESIKFNDDKEDKIANWKQTFKNIVLDEASRISKSIGDRAYIGIKDRSKKYINIALAFNQLVLDINKF